MSRRRAAVKREILPDPLFKDHGLAKFINTVMEDGKKSVAESIVYGALDGVLGEVVAGKLVWRGNERADDEGGDSGEGSVSLKPQDLHGKEGIYSSGKHGALARKIAMDQFKQALRNITPSVEVKSRRVGGATYQVPVEIKEGRRNALAMRWMVASARKRSERSMDERLKAEIIDAIASRGNAFKKKEDTHRMADANKAFAHFRW
jgi:small subunit ribosomal protein S7